MKKYTAVFATSYEVEAEDIDTAEDMAWELFEEDMGTNSKLGLFFCQTEEKE
jgi:hypothetical protein